MATRLYLSNDTSARAAGAAALAEAWSDRTDVQLIRTSSRGAFYLEPMVERDGPDGRIAWFNVSPQDLPAILSGTGGTAVHTIPFLPSRRDIHLPTSVRLSPCLWMNTRLAVDCPGWKRRFA